MHRSALVLVLVVALLVVPQTTLAQSSMPPSPPPGSVWTVFTTVEAVVRDNYATVKVIADIGNQGPDPEFPFVVRIPDDAFVTGLTIVRDGQTFEAEIKDRETAREDYEEWKGQQQTGGLVEKSRRTSVYSYLINVAEFTSATATLTYERYLVADRGVYNLSLEAPVSGFGRDLGARFSVTVRDSDGLVSLWGEPAGSVSGDTVTYEVGPRPGTEFPTPFTASYMLASTADAGTLLTTIVDGQGYFAHRFRAPADAQELPMDLVLVLDVSGSMAGLKLQQMIDSAKQVVGTLHEDDRLHIVAFSSDSTSPWSGLKTMTPEERRNAVREIEALFDGGGTNIESGLRRGFTAFSGIDWSEEEGRFPALVLLTDGQPTAGVTSRDQLRTLAEDLNTRDINVFGIAFGDDADWTLIRHLAQDGEGAAIRVPPGAGAEVDLRRFMAALTTPVLRNVIVDYNDGVTALHTGAPVLFAASELLVVGTFDPAKGIRGTVTALAPDGERSYTFEGASGATGLSFLPRLVAYQEVRMLQEEETADGATTSTTQRIKTLALQHGFVTDHTSLVVLLPERDFREFDAVNGSGDPRMMGDGSTASTPPTCPGCATTDQSSAGNSGGGWWPFGSKTASETSADGVAMRDDDGYAYDGGPSPTSQPAVPGPGLALVLVALGAAAFVVAKRRS